MGDLIELTTWWTSSKTFFKISSSAITFEVKAGSNAAIGLSKDGKMPCDVTFYLDKTDYGRRSLVMTSDGAKYVLKTANIVSSQVYRKFWLTWWGGNASMGYDGDMTPLLTIPVSSTNLRYITFYITFGSLPIHWRFQLPPAEKDICRYSPLQSGELNWVSHESVCYSDAIVGGFEEEPLFIMRAAHESSLTPGKLLTSKGVGIIAWGGAAHVKTNFEVLCGYNYAWVQTSENKLPHNALIGGYSEHINEPLYIGRVVHEKHLIVGKVQPSHNCCYFPFNNKELPSTVYEILVNNSIDEGHEYIDCTKEILN